MMVGDSFLEASGLAIQLVNQLVDRHVHVVSDGLGVEVFAAGVECCLRLMSNLLDGEDDLGVDQMIKMPLDARQFLRDEVAQRIGQVDVMAGDIWKSSGQTMRRRSWEGGRSIASLYFATVRRAT